MGVGLLVHVFPPVPPVATSWTPAALGPYCWEPLTTAFGRVLPMNELMTVGAAGSLQPTIVRAVTGITVEMRWYAYACCPVVDTHENQQSK
jgi:hypothetical protein